MKTDPSLQRKLKSRFPLGSANVIPFEEAFDRLQPVFSRKVKFLELMIIRGECYVELAARIN